MTSPLLRTRNDIKKVFVDSKADEFYVTAKKSLKELFNSCKKIIDDRAFWDELKSCYLILIPVYSIMRVSDNNSNWEATTFIYPLMSEVDQYFLAQPTAIGRNKSFFSKFNSGKIFLTTHQRQKFITVNFAKFRDTAKNEVTKFRGKNHGFHGSSVVKILNSAVISQ